MPEMDWATARNVVMSAGGWKPFGLSGDLWLSPDSQRIVTTAQAAREVQAELEQRQEEPA